MADDKLREMVNTAENNIIKLFDDDSAMKTFLGFLRRNDQLTYYAASMVSETDYADTYEGWKERGYQVKAGEHGAAVFQKRKTINRKFVDETGKIRDLSTATFEEKQKIQNGDLKLNSDLTSFYTVQYLFSQEQTTADGVNLDVEIPESSLKFENIKSLIEDSVNDILDGDDFVMPNSIMQCTVAYATYMLSLSDHVSGNKDEIFEKAIENLADSKARLTLSEKKLVLNSAIKVFRSEHTKELLNNLKEEIAKKNFLPENETDEKIALPELKDEPESKNKIEDFGKKIGGARKDIWKQRGLMVGDLFEMNIAEKNKYGTKNYIFPKPDYQKMVDDGLPVRTAYFIKTIRDAIPAKPVFDYFEKDSEELIAKKIEGYVEFVSEFKDILFKIKTDTDILSFYKYAIRDVYVKQESTYRVVPTEKSHGCMTNKLLNACQINAYGLSRLDSQIKKKQFCYSEHDKKIDGFEVVRFDDSCEFETDRGRTVLKRNVDVGAYYYYPEAELADASKWIKDTCYVLYKRHIVANNLSEEQAKETIENMAERISAIKTDGKEGEKKTRKKKFVPEQLQHIERTGPSNGINEYHHADGQLYLDTFGFAGGEFGNWMNENDRQASLDFGYDAFMDLADALDIDPKDISLGGELSIAFGSRGISGAAAHYEPLRQVINLTKMNGAGSLAHEWGHALDNILSKKIKGSGIDTWLTDAKRNDGLESVKNLIHTMEYRPALEEDTKSMKRTDFYTNSIKFDSVYGKDSKGYWQSKQEMFARAFACYVKDKLSYKSDYLCGHADTSVAVFDNDIIKAFPEGKERESINKGFDEVIAQLKDMGLLHSQEHIRIKRKSH